MPSGTDEEPVGGEQRAHAEERPAAARAGEEEPETSVWTPPRRPPKGEAYRPWRDQGSLRPPMWERLKHQVEGGEQDGPGGVFRSGANITLDDLARQGSFMAQPVNGACACCCRVGWAMPPLPKQPSPCLEATLHQPSFIIITSTNIIYQRPLSLSLHQLSYRRLHPTPLVCHPPPTHDGTSWTE